MKILLLCEPRSGSTMLGFWFHRQGNFDVRWETTTPDSRHSWKQDLKDIKIKTGCEHLVLKELVTYRRDWDEYLEFCDKVVFLHREDFEDQLISYNYSLTKNIWDQFYSEEEANSVTVKDSNRIILQGIKKHFSGTKEKYFTDSHLSITYEDLYFRNKIHILKDYLNLPDKLDRKFPEGSRYRYKKDNPWSTDPFYKKFH